MSEQREQTNETLFYTVVIAAVISVVSLCIGLRPLLSPGIPAGWDLTPNAYLQVAASKIICGGKTSGYDSLWLGGYDAFRYYGILPYIPASLFACITRNPLSAVEGFRYTVILAPLLLYVLIIIVCRQRDGGPGLLAGLVFGFHFLSLDHRFIHSGSGLVSLTVNGHFASAWGLILFIAAVCLLLKDKPLKRSDCFLLVILTCLLAYTHTLSLLALIGTSLIAAAFHGRHGLRVLLSLGAGLAGGLPLIMHAAEMRDLLGTSAVSLIGGGADPFLVLFPGFTDLLRFITSGSLPHPPRSVLSVAPVLSLLFLASICAGTVDEWKRKSCLLPSLFWLTFIIVPHHILIDAFPDIPVHWYRFTSNAFVLGILLASRGFSSFEKAAAREIGSSSIRPILYTACIAGVCLAAPPVIRLFPSGQASLSETAAAHGIDFTRFSRELSRTSRIAGDSMVLVESDESTFEQLGSPHALTTILPLKYGIRVFPGLLAESSTVFAPLQTLLTTAGDSIQWGYFADRRIVPSSLTPAQYASLLHWFGVRLIIARSEKFKNFLDSAPPTHLFMLASPPFFRIYSVNSRRTGPGQHLRGKPVFWFDQGGGPSFREFMVWSLRDPLLYRVPVIQIRAPIEETPDVFLEEASMILISRGAGVSPSEAEMRVKKLNIPAVIVSTGAAGRGDFPSISLDPTAESLQKARSLLKSGGSGRWLPLRRISRKKNCYSRLPAGWIVVPRGFSPLWSPEKAAGPFPAMGGLTAVKSKRGGAVCHPDSIE